MTDTFARMDLVPQPIGAPLPDWTPPRRPGREALSGGLCRLEPLDPAAHADALFDVYSNEGDVRLWTYLPYGPFANCAEFHAWMRQTCLGADPLFFAIVEAASGRPLGLAAYLRIDPKNGVIEIGHLAFSSTLRRATAATEALYLLLAHAFALGYRRCEWKCDALNAPSRAAAARLGFTFEGIFRQAVVVKGRNRDTAWYSIIDTEWPARRARLERWLSADNFDEHGHQRTSLSATPGDRT